MQISNSKILLDIIKAAKKAKSLIKDLSWREYETHGEFCASTATRRFGSWEVAKKRAAKCNPKTLVDEVKKLEVKEARDKKKEEIIKAYLTVVQQKKNPTLADLAEVGISRDSVFRAFGSFANLDIETRKHFPDAFSDVYISSLFSPKRLENIDEILSTYERLVITTAVNGCPTHMPSYLSVKKYCEINDAVLLILITSDPAHNMDKGNRELPIELRYGTIDKILAGEVIVLKDVEINNNLRIDTIKTSAKMIDPTTGLSRLGQRNGSLIIASPKCIQVAVPVSNCKLPHIITTTCGAITESNYNSSNYMSERLAKIADHDHQLGAIVVEVEDKELFHIRQLQFAPDGSFYDIAKGRSLKYTTSGAERAEAEAFVLGDWHSGDTDPVVADIWKEVASIAMPKYIVVHDGFNGTSINHHEDNDKILKSQRAQNSQLSLEKELEMFANDLHVLSSFATQSLVVVKSNHDEFLERYLKECRYVEDPHNHYFSLKLSIAMHEGLDPLQYGVEELIGLKDGTNLKWLKRSEDFKVARIQLGAHGDKGPNGSRGSLKSMEAAFGQCVTGHSHTSAILRGAWSVGTSSFLKLKYNEASPSSWINSSCLIWPNGQRQLINAIVGKYRLMDE